jgi:MFS family permease
MHAPTADAGAPLGRNLQYYLVVRLTGSAANQMVLVALGWQMYDLTSSAWDLGLVGLVQFLPALLLTIPAGQLVDRVDRRAVLATALVVQAGVAAVLAWASAFDQAQRELILATSAAIGVARALQAPAQQALLPGLVPLASLARATAMSSSVMQLAVIGGPALGGFVYVAGPASVYGLALAMFVVAIGCITAIRYRSQLPGAMPITMNSLFAGVRFIWTHKVVLGAVSLDLFAVLLGGAVALLPIFARDVLDTGPWGLGLLRAAPAVGALAMAVTLARRPLERRVGRKMLVAVAIFGVAILVFAVSRHFLLSLAALAVSGAADMVSVVLRQTLVQLDTPDEMRGRVSAVNATFIGASNQLGEFRAGAVAEWLGAVGSAVVGGIGTLLVVLAWSRLFPALTQRDRLHR